MCVLLHPCSFQPWKETVPDAALAAQLMSKLKAQLRAELAPLLPAKASAASEAQQAGGALPSIWELAGQPHVDDPAYLTLDATVTRVLSRFLLNGDGSRACVCGQRRGEGRGPAGAQLGARRCRARACKGSIAFSCSPHQPAPCIMLAAAGLQ